MSGVGRGRVQDDREDDEREPEDWSDEEIVAGVEDPPDASPEPDEEYEEEEYEEEVGDRP